MRPALFALDPEVSHNLMMGVLAQPIVARTVALVAGVDKQGTATAVWDAMGFGHAEIGTVTPRPQPGNPRPRLFRLPEDAAIVNRLGFPGAGLAAVGRNLARTAGRNGDFGLNIGPNKERV